MSERSGPVIIVDDDVAVGESLKFALEMEGLSVRVYGSGKELLTATDLPSKGCYVIDYLMPGMNGCEVMRKLQERRIDCPAILITSNATEEIRGCAMRSGYRCVVEKPLEDDMLLEAIQMALASEPADHRIG